MQNLGFAQIKLLNSHQIQHHAVSQGNPISQLVNIGVKDQAVAVEVFDIFLKEIGLNDQHPVLLAIDEINAFYHRTEYLDTDAHLLSPWKLTLVRTFLEYYGGKRRFKRGAAIGSLSSARTDYQSRVLDVALGFREQSPYNPVSSTLLKYAQGLRRFDVKEYTQEEAKALLDYYKSASVIHQEPSEQYFFKQFMLSSGNARQFYLNCTRKI